MHTITLRAHRETRAVTEHRPGISRDDERGKLIEEAAQYINDKLDGKNVVIEERSNNSEPSPKETLNSVPPQNPEVTGRQMAEVVLGEPTQASPELMSRVKEEMTKLTPEVPTSNADPKVAGADFGEGDSKTVVAAGPIGATDGKNDKHPAPEAETPSLDLSSLETDASK